MNAQSCLMYNGGAGEAMNFDARLCVSESGVTVISWTLRGFGKEACLLMGGLIGEPYC